MKRRRSHPGILSALHLRELSPTPSAHASFRTAAYSALVPSSTFISISAVPSVSFRRFTPCGRYLIAISRNSRDLILYRFETGGARQLPTSPATLTPDFDSLAYNPTIPSPHPNAPHSATHNCSALSTPHLVDPTLRTPPPALSAHSAAMYSGTAALAAATIAATASSPRPAARFTATGLLETLPVPIRGEEAAVTPPTTRVPSAASARARSRESITQQYSCHFERFFTHMYQLAVAPVAETLVPDFCLATPGGKYLILASYAAPDDPHGAAQVPTAMTGERAGIPAVASVPVLEKFTLSLVDVERGVVADRFVLTDDSVVLEGHGGVHMYGDLLCVLSIRHQTLHVIKVQENLGRFSEQTRIGAMCGSDDEVEIGRAREAELCYQRRELEMGMRRKVDLRFPFGSDAGTGVDAVVKNARTRLTGAEGIRTPLVATPSIRQGRLRAPERTTEGIGEGDRHPPPRIGGTQTEVPPTETGLGNGRLRKGFYTGLMQRLLVYVYRKYHQDGKQSIFYRHVEQYGLLVMLKAQFLDADHLLIRLGSHERNGRIPDAATSTCFFVVYCISSATILNLFENRSAELLAIFEKYRDEFIGDAAVSATLPPPRNRIDGEDDVQGGGTQSSGLADRGLREANGEQGRSHRLGTAARDRRANLKTPVRIRTELAALPVSCQTRNVSPYLDRRLFSYNIDRISALDGTKALSFRELNTVKFMSAEYGTLRFKLSSGIPATLLEKTRRESNEIGHEVLTHMQRKRKALFLFHPFYPFVMSMEYSLVTPTTYNFHVYGHI